MSARRPRPARGAVIAAAALLALLGAGLLGARCAARAAQPVRRSQHGTVTQMIGRTEVAISYNRPVARGRALFGALVPWGRVWNPGADTATTITVSADVLVNGRPLRKGTYSLWAIPDTAAWTMIFSTAQPVWHMPYPEGRDALRVRAAPRTGSHMEVLAFYFPIVEPDSAVLDLHWGITIVPLAIRVR